MPISKGIHKGGYGTREESKIQQSGSNDLENTSGKLLITKTVTNYLGPNGVGWHIILFNQLQSAELLGIYLFSSFPSNNEE